MASQAEASTDSIQLQKRHNQTETDRALEEGPEDDAKLVGLQDCLSSSEQPMLTDNGTYLGHLGWAQ